MIWVLFPHSEFCSPSSAPAGLCNQRFTAVLQPHHRCLHGGAFCLSWALFCCPQVPWHCQQGWVCAPLCWQSPAPDRRSELSAARGALPAPAAPSERAMNAGKSLGKAEHGRNSALSQQRLVGSGCLLSCAPAAVAGHGRCLGSPRAAVA